jgi:hypothetical protein
MEANHRFILRTKLAYSTVILIALNGLTLEIGNRPASAQSFATDCKSIGGTVMEYKNSFNRSWCFFYNKNEKLYVGLTKSSSLNAWIRIGFFPSKTSNRTIIDGSTCPYTFDFARRKHFFNGCIDLRGALIRTFNIDRDIKQNDYLLELSEAGKTMTNWLTEKKLMSGSF